MAQHLRSDLSPGRARRRWWALALVPVLAVPASLVLAQVPSDPTRPPDSMTLPGISAPGAAGAALAAGPMLQSILIAGARTEAIISGRVVRPGDQIAMGQIVKISESEVTVRTNAGLQTLKLFPGIEKRYAEAQDSAAPAKRNKAKAK